MSDYAVGVLPNGFYYNDQPYAPAAGQPGSTAISKDDASFIAWATNVQVERGHVNISNPDYIESDKNSNYASYGEPGDAVGQANNSPVSLGDAGEAIVTFLQPITDGSGADFAIFENSFSDTFLELAFVEVSSDGVNYFRFPSHSKTQTSTQVGGFGSVDPTKINNLAGKYKVNFGTPFDLSDIADHALLDKTTITHVKLIDVVGSIDPLYARYDSFGNAINELFATPFWQGGFDLDAVGVINQKTLGINDFKNNNTIALYPNPASSSFQVSETGMLEIYSISGRLVLKQEVKVKQTSVAIDHLVSGMYVVKFTNSSGTRTQKLIKQ
ncbi:secretion protein [Pseudalgibacter alginicilyticus]|uniref:Secretion protein n=1 Tax=Pseudalgibacter alginicilyticus TaxID=1736674 RepID=A0A0P0D1H7_9FLAO|nr:secretion protein [Pseudalgibacter alginicilyticus]